jgi:queuine tRNA-ribosyltransferase
MFRLEAEDGARAGTLTTAHGDVRTPAFMPVGTRATVRGQTIETLKAAGSQILLANTFHLLRRPGPDVFEKLGGIHRFMAWDGPVLTDSGGFQAFSLGAAFSEEGAVITDDGRRTLLSPEASIRMQRAIRSDVAMVMDVCVPSTVDHGTARSAMERTLRWAVRCLGEPRAGQLFGIVQGACFPDLRAESAARTVDLGFDGYALGGLAVGESKAEREDVTAHTAPLLPRDKPRYLMGVGTPLDLLEGVARGIDLFDCILPTAMAQQGVVWTSVGRLELRRGTYRASEDRLDDCPCPVCTRYSRAYLHHLVRSQEVLAWQLLGTHNLHFYHALMAAARRAVLEGRWDAFYREHRGRLDGRDPDHPIRPPKPKRERHGVRLGDYEVVPGETVSIRQISSGEVMHPDPDEPQRLYVARSRLASRLHEEGSALILWDVGLGAGMNAMAAVAAAGPRPLEIVSFEQDLDALRLAVRHAGWFPHVRHAAPRAILAAGSWSHGTVTWRLLPGDFLDRLADAPAPDVVFYDPFSARADGPLWTIDAFRRLRSRCQSTELLTHTRSTAARAAMLAAGWWVARGVPSGDKEETTLAATHPIPGLLGPDWLERLARSPARPEDAGPDLLEILRRHPQFRGPAPG